PDLKSNVEAIELILEGIDKAGYQSGDQLAIALDPATSELWREGGQYEFFKSDKSRKSSSDMIDLWESWIDQYPIISLEDGLGEKDWEGWQELTERLGDRVQLVGDDIFCTNPKIIQEAINKGVGNASLIKVN
ncbi:MAG: phosphopyruvate hydratase, partial [Microcystis sp.]